MQMKPTVNQMGASPSTCSVPNTVATFDPTIPSMIDPKNTIYEDPVDGCMVYINCQGSASGSKGGEASGWRSIPNPDGADIPFTTQECIQASGKYKVDDLACKVETVLPLNGTVGDMISTYYSDASGDIICMAKPAGPCDGGGPSVGSQSGAEMPSPAPEEGVWFVLPTSVYNSPKACGLHAGDESGAWLTKALEPYGCQNADRSYTLVLPSDGKLTNKLMYMYERPFLDNRKRGAASGEVPSTAVDGTSASAVAGAAMATSTSGTTTTATKAGSATATKAGSATAIS